MDRPVLHINMLGGFSLHREEREINSADDRMRKVWLLLACLIYRRAVVSQEELTSLLWDESPEAEASSGALKTMLYRARTLLNRLYDGAGAELILRREGGYLWNPEVPVCLDVAEFDTLYRRIGTAREEERLALQRQLLELYAGDFLPKMSSEAWVLPVSAYYHRIYLETVEQVLPALEEQEQWEEAGAICAAALKVEPYSEELHCHLIRSHLARGDNAAAISAYESMSELLFSHFGVMPSDEARALYRQASRSGGTDATHISSAHEQLREEDAPSGALFCEYDFFRILYQAQARAIIRSGDCIHIALMTVTGRRGKELPRRSLDTAVENLKQILIGNLRQGDIVTQCSLSQLLVMLPQANYEDSCKVCDRLVKSFFRQYPHTPADVHYSVQPLEPAGSER